ncbi:MAG: hypothetical protein K9K39_02565, partial [Desulfohalobiaceae bacterium]|nr:hypothetical protein [Desulfohalobiaceae bacterium]
LSCFGSQIVCPKALHPAGSLLKSKKKVYPEKGVLSRMRCEEILPYPSGFGFLVVTGISLTGRREVAGVGL